MLINGFGFSGYRSVGNDLVRISPLKKVNLIIGKNNSEKSNIIKFLSEQYVNQTNSIGRKNRFNRGSEKSSYTEIDYHISPQKAQHKISYALTKDKIDSYLNQKLPDDYRHKKHREIAKKLLFSDQFLEQDMVWFTYKSKVIDQEFELDFDVDLMADILLESEWNYLWSGLTNQSGGSLKATWLPETIRSLSYVPETLPSIEVIPAIRKIGGAGTEAKDYSGEGIIERLAKIQNPQLSSQKLKEKFRLINDFIKDVLQNSSAEIEIPYERDMILVHMDGRTLPLESLGTGVHEVVILAAAATLLNETILCIEEPELHLHPLLQKKLVKYLAEKTENQYFFTTHSAHLLDATEAEIFHITLVDGVSKVDAISSTKQKSNICNDLGYKASDILQANCVIWVEGPSDRIYLNYWLKHHTLDLIEGVHFSIMFYGGRLFSHLTAVDDDVEVDAADDLISIRNLNRHSAIMFDSDKNCSRAHISPTKKRLRDEFDKGPGFAWVTKGREIENYLNFDKVEESVKAVHPSASDLVSKGEWENLLIYKKQRSNEEKSASKVKVARHYIRSNAANFEVLDLSERMNQLVTFIKIANGM